MKKIFSFLESLPMTIVGGVFLAISLVLLLTDTKMLIDPAWVTVFICGLPLLYLALTRLIFQRWVSSALLISIAMVAAIAIGELFAAGEVAFIMAIGALLEERAAGRARKGISKLLNLAPQKGRRIITVDGNITEEIVPVEEIHRDDLLRVFPGETIPVDGKIVFGNTSIDQSIMTGESLPVDKSIGDDVFCGTINRFGSIDIEATKVGKDSSLQKMVDMVKSAENKKAPMERIVDKWATWLVPIALLIAILAYFFTGDIVRAVTVLVVFCPCALVLATPTSVIAAIGQATKHGVLIKSGEALEAMGKVNSVTFDKTGTLTYGKLEISDLLMFSDDMNERDLLSLIASAELRSEHPLGKAVVKYARDKGIDVREPSTFEMIPGKGLKAVIDEHEVICSNTALLQENGIQIEDKVTDSLQNIRQEGKASILVALNGKCVGLVALSDVIRPDAKEMVGKLQKMGTEVILLTGDNKQAASYFAEQAGIDTIYAELLPGQKVEQIEILQQEGRKVCMIGDGVNDAPALKTADVGVAMGSMGSDIAIEAADIALMGDEISKIPYLKKLSNSTLSTIKFNITLSMVINFVAIGMSLMGWLNPITGALVHNAGSVLVVLNAALLYDRKLKY
ncbi:MULTISPECIES: cation-translocating P-type ATPase [Bacteroidales]|nr:MULTISPECIES: cation-translocating P-type ATPase [Bacteroidales]MCP3896203.1 cation-translocating P-type ATPase [Bacteroides sp.]OJX56588.1 MAG: copper-translocating P-type ATPase [Dysgonomonas sp. 37-18]PKP37355.1 MAG: copper-translocating P-type ATPase [Bacteroidetes bacterium HGW-Bacteroidetes-14]